MAQGRPPRHSKSKRDPVTIDLEAEKITDGPKDEMPEKTEESAETSTTAATSTDEAPVAGSDGAPGTPPEARETAPESTPAAEAAVSSDTSADRPAAEEAAAGDADTGFEKPADRPDEGSSSAEPVIGPAPTEGGTGNGRAFVAGLVGGVLAAAVLYALLATGTLPIAGANDQAASRTAGTLADLGSEVDTLKQNVADLAAREPAAGGNDAAVAELKKQVAALSQSVDDLKAAAGNAAGASSANLSELRQSVSALQDTTGALQDGAKQTGSTVAALSDRVNRIETELSKPSDETRLARSIAAIGLRSAVERGGPFDAELQAYRSVAPNDPALDTLGQIAAEGVPSQRQLISRFPEVADAILSATRPQDADSGVFDRLVSSARSLVKVRPTGNVEGNTPEAIVARMEAKLNDGDLKGVVAEWQALPEAGKQASQSFIDQVNRRLSALTAVDDILRETNRAASNATEDGQAQ